MGCEMRPYDPRILVPAETIDLTVYILCRCIFCKQTMGVLIFINGPGLSTRMRVMSARENLCPSLGSCRTQRDLRFLKAA